MEKLKKKYGLPTGIAMVVGIVIGSGVFFKAARVLSATEGKLSLSLVAWFLGGAIMVISAYCFSLAATRIEKVNGVVDYVEAATNKKTGFATAWYFTVLYYPILVAILAFISVLYFYQLAGLAPVATWHFWVVVGLLIIASFALNTVAPKLAGQYQVATTVIKMIPIFVVAVIGTVLGVINGNTVTAFESFGLGEGVRNDFGAAILATIFAYEGWVVATSINAELKDSKKNLPLALILGSMIVIVSYLLYYLGLSSLIPNTNDIIDAGAGAPLVAMNQLFGTVGEFLFNMLIIISCLGTLNGLTMGGSRGMYSIASRNVGPKPELFKKLHPKFNTSVASSVFGLVMSLFFMFVWLISFLTPFSYLGGMDELSIAFVYSVYIFIYIWIMKNGKDLKVFSRYVMPSLAIVCSVFLAFAATGLFTLVTTKDSGMFVSFLVFLGLTVALMVPGFFFYKKNGNEDLETQEV